MKISENNIRQYDNSTVGDDIDELFDYNDIAGMSDDEREAFFKEHPAAAAIAAITLVGAPAVGIGATSLSGQASAMPDDDVTATMVQNHGEESESVTELTKNISFTVSGPGHIEAVSNCSIEGNTIHFTNPDRNITFKVVKDVDGAEVNIKSGNVELPSDTDVVELEAHSDYVLSIQFTDVVAQQKAAAEAQAQAEAQQKAAAEAQVAQASASAQQDKTSHTKSSSNKSGNKTKASNKGSNGGTASSGNSGAASSSSSSSSSTSSSPSSGAAQNAMTSEELAVAHDIFDSYNAYRASKGLPTVAWSDDCANMAYGSATGCAARGQLTHRLGIPGGVQNCYSDILQYSTWKMSGSEAVSRWQGSTGHRKMMQCNTASIAGVGAYESNGTWYYAIVYNFSGTNQSGS